jgi:very-short-patch-repair endonuclease
MIRSRPNAQEVLIAILRDRLDFNRLREQLWYRIPLDSVQRRLGERWPPTWLAFYQTRVFGTTAYSIRYYGRVTHIRTVPRAEMFPDEPQDARSRRLYYQVFLESLNELPRPIPSRRLRRVVFIPTTWEKLVAAGEINDLYDDSPLEDELWRQFKKQGINAERQERVQIGGRRYFLDFAIFCGTGKLDVETDGDTYHSNLEKAAIDNLRNNDLQALGWSVLRFNTAQIRESISDYCVPKVVETVNGMGGIARDGDLPERLQERLIDGSYQLDMFTHEGKNQ